MSAPTHSLAVVICPFAYLCTPGSHANLRGVAVAGGPFLDMLEDPRRGGWLVWPVQTVYQYQRLKVDLERKFADHTGLITDVLVWCTTHAWASHGDLSLALCDTVWSRDTQKFEDASAARLSVICEKVSKSRLLSKSARLLVVADCCAGAVTHEICERLDTAFRGRRQSRRGDHQRNVIVGAIAHSAQSPNADELLLLDVLHCAGLTRRDMFTVGDMLPRRPNDALDLTTNVVSGLFNDLRISSNPKRSGDAPPVGKLMKCIGEVLPTEHVLQVLRQTDLQLSGDLSLWRVPMVGRYSDARSGHGQGLGSARVLAVSCGTEDAFTRAATADAAYADVLFKKLSALAAVSLRFSWDKVVACAYSVSDAAKLAAERHGFTLKSWTELRTDLWSEHRDMSIAFVGAVDLEESSRLTAVTAGLDPETRASEKVVTSTMGTVMGRTPVTVRLRPSGGDRMGATPSEASIRVLVKVPRGVARKGNSPVRQLFEAWADPTRFRATLDHLVDALKDGIVAVRFVDLAGLAPLPTDSNLKHVIRELKTLAESGPVEAVIPIGLFRDDEEAAGFLKKAGRLQVIHDQVTPHREAVLTVSEIFPRGNPLLDPRRGTGDWRALEAFMQTTLAENRLPTWLMDWSRAMEEKEIPRALVRLCTMALGAQERLGCGAAISKKPTP